MSQQPTSTETFAVTAPRNRFYEQQGWSRLVEVTIERWEDIGLGAFAHVVAKDEYGAVWAIDTRHGETEEQNAELLVKRGYTFDRCCFVAEQNATNPDRYGAGGEHY